MQRNANVGSKLLALIAVPAVVLVAVASLGARERLDDADRAQQTEDGARLAASSTRLAHEFQLERLLAMRLVEGDDSVTDQLAEQRQAVDAAGEALVAPHATVGDERVAQRLEAATGQIQTVAELRSSIDEGSAAPEVVLDAYTTAIDSLLGLDAALASRSGIAELSSTLTDSLTLAKAKEARALRSAQIAGIATVGEFRNGDYEALATLEAEEDRQFSRLEESQDGAMTTSVRNAMATEPVRDADALLAAVMEEGVIGGSGDPGVAPDDWQASATDWLTSLRAAEAGTLDATIATANASAFEAGKSARLFLIGTAAAVILSILLASLLARRINRRLRHLTVAANQLATVELPRLVEDLRSPGDLSVPAEPIVPIEVDSGDEIGQLAEAFNAIQQMTSQVAEEQAALLRRGIADIFVNLARRNQSLLDRQLEFIDGLEAQEQDPDQLENLFKLDHLATRMRRNAESLLVLAGAEPPRRRARPVELADVVRVAIGEVEDFTRIQLSSLEETTVGGNAAVDLAHLLSELMENATQFSPPDSTVEVVGARTAEGGYTLTVADCGIGMSADQVAEANDLLSSPPPVGLALSRSLGFIVVGRLARRLEVRVRLAASSAGGITAVVDLPASVLSGQTVAEGIPAPAADLSNGGVGPTPRPVEEPRPLVVDDAPVPPTAPPDPGPTPRRRRPWTLRRPSPTRCPTARTSSGAWPRWSGPRPRPPPATPTSTRRSGVDWPTLRRMTRLRTWPARPKATGPLASRPRRARRPPSPSALKPRSRPSARLRPRPRRPLPRPTPSPRGNRPPTGSTASWRRWRPRPRPRPPRRRPPPRPVATPAPLTRRQPRATLTADDAVATAPASSGSRTASTRRSPEEVRAMLSRYRRGIEEGRQAPGSED